MYDLLLPPDIKRLNDHSVVRKRNVRFYYLQQTNTCSMSMTETLEKAVK